MDTDASSNSDDHGLPTDTVPTLHDNLSENFEMTPASSDDHGIQHGLTPVQSDDHGIQHGPEASISQPPVPTRRRLRCVCCGLNVTRIRRHLLEIVEFRSLVQQWLQPRQVQVANDSVVCHSCWTVAWNQIRNPAQPQSPPPYRHVCISCGRSLNRLTNVHTLRSDTPRENRIRNMIVSEIAPQELPRSAALCHACWQRNDRAVTPPPVQAEDMSEAGSQPEPAEPSFQMPSVILPNYIRAPLTQSRCFYPDCRELDRHVVPTDLRVRLFCDFNYYVQKDCKICSFHLRNNLWDSLIENIVSPIRSFSPEQIEDFASLLKDSIFTNLDFNNICNMPDHIVHYYTGHTKDQFRELISLPRLSTMRRGPLALAAYLMKLRTGDSDERLSALLKVPRSTLERYMKQVRNILIEDFVPSNLGLNHISREDIISRNLLIPNGLYGGGQRKPIVIGDGTYIYIEKSSNYLYQKKTYSLHKYRNLVKPFLFVCTDGYIVDVLGPYPATTSDANIIIKEFESEDSPYRQFFETGDVFILDRGFRDALPLLERCGYDIHVPLSPEDGESQLTTIDANKSRAVTMCRWVVEVVNGIFKMAFKLFRQNFVNTASQHLIIDFKIAAALINKYHTKVSDRDDAAQILEIVNRKMNIENDLSEYVRLRNLNRARADFVNINVSTENVAEFPVLTLSDLVLIACGTYQLKQARSYYGEHIRNDGSYHIEICRNRRNSLMEASNFGSNCMLIRARISSRHISRKIYFVYILIQTNEIGYNAIEKYCCNCIVGRRTVGCCAHVMTVIWYLGWARHQTGITAPARFLDNVLIVYDNDE